MPLEGILFGAPPAEVLLAGLRQRPERYLRVGGIREHHAGAQLLSGPDGAAFLAVAGL